MTNNLIEELQDVWSNIKAESPVSQWAKKSCDKLNELTERFGKDELLKVIGDFCKTDIGAFDLRHFLHGEKNFEYVGDKLLTALEENAKPKWELLTFDAIDFKTGDRVKYLRRVPVNNDGNLSPIFIRISHRKKDGFEVCEEATIFDGLENFERQMGDIAEQMYRVTLPDDKIKFRFATKE